MIRLEKRAKAAVALAMAMLLMTMVCLYVGRNAPGAIQAGSAALSPEQEDPVTRFRTEREQLRSRQQGQLNDIIHSQDADNDTINLAQRQLIKLMEAQAYEQRLEGILKVRGFTDALVTFNDSSVNVILQSEALDRRETAQILDLVLRETGVTAGNVKILSINQ